jgi:two-component system NtrC family response regulator
MARILIIDDEMLVCDVISRFCSSMGYESVYAFSLKEGLPLASKNSFDLVFLDIKLPDGDGLDAIGRIKKMPGSPEVIIITGAGSSDGAELAVKNGAWDYIEKPLSANRIKLSLIRVFQYRQGKSTQKTPLVLKREGIVGNSPEIKACIDLVAKAADNDANVLITGETGTGKELFARAIHDNSRRREHAFVVVDCAALPETLIESTLFGHEKGAFTGADRAREGLIREADGGTLFLDEVGELPLAQQKAFLRVLQERRFRPIGGKRDTASDFRLIAATHRQIDEMVKDGTFRQDLLFRLQSLSIQIPALRDRSGDIKDIASYYLTRLSGKYGPGQKGYSPEFLDAITRYGWPGNVRELIHAIESALSEARGDPTLFPIHLPTYIRSKLARASVGEDRRKPKNLWAGIGPKEPLPQLKELLNATEKGYFQRLITVTGGDIQEICRISGITRSNVYARFKKYKLSKTHCNT